MNIIPDHSPDTEPGRQTDRPSLEARLRAHVRLAASRQIYLALDDVALRAAVDKMDRWKDETTRSGHMHADGPLVPHDIRRAVEAQ
jgi:hypothetical protein